MFLGEKKIVKLLHFPNITPTEQRRLLMSESESASASEEEHKQLAGVNSDAANHHKPPRKKSSTKRSLDMQRKISLSKLRDEKKEKETISNSLLNNNYQSSPESSTPSSSPSINSMPPKHKTHRLNCTKNGKISDGYDQYLKQYLLQVPMPKDYGEPSSDDLSSEWDSDVAENKCNEPNCKESKVTLTH